MLKSSMSPDKSFNVEDGDFKKASASGQRSPWYFCVEVAVKSQGVAVRDTKDPSKKTLFFTPQEWACFVKGVKGGEFDPIGGVEASLPVV